MQSTSRQHILFIINPNSGVRSKSFIPDAIQKHLDPQLFTYEIAYTKAPKHAIELAQDAVKKGIDIVAAVGGDGSINEVASQLVHTNTTLAVLPHGSGNGFAMHTGIGRNIIKAIEYINNGRVVTIDTARMNDQPFINLAGLGFDGLIAYRLSEANRRGFWSYFQISIEQAFYAKSHHYTIQLDDEPAFERGVFLLEVGNGTMFGYGFTIVPTADLQDGLLDLLLVKKTNKLQYLPLVPRLLFANIHKGGRLVEHYKAKKISIEFDAPVFAHYDGEGFVQSSNKVTYEVVPKSLNIILPQE